jgi:hypothetical protein
LVRAHGENWTVASCREVREAPSTTVPTVAFSAFSFIEYDCLPLDVTAADFVTHINRTPAMPS